MEHPDPKKHQYVSFVKSGVRILGCAAAMAMATHGSVFILAGALLVAELIGVYEELV